jgi:hypothetical protein
MIRSARLVICLAVATLAGLTANAQDETGPLPPRLLVVQGERSAVAVRFNKRLDFVIYSHTHLDAEINEEKVSPMKSTWSGYVEQRRADGMAKRFELHYSTDKPDVIVLDGKEFAIANPLDAAKEADGEDRGPWFLLTSFGRLVPSGRFFEAPHDPDSLDPKKEYSLAWYMDQDVHQAETYRHNFDLDDLKDWVIAWDEQHPISHSDGARVARLRIFADGRIVGARSHLEPLVHARLSKAEVDALVADLIAMARKPDVVVDPKLTVASSPLGRGLWDQHQDVVHIHRDGERHLVHVTHPGRRDPVGDVSPGWKEMNERLWKLLQAAKPDAAGGGAAVEDRLAKKVDLAVTGKPLLFVLDELEKAHGVAVTIKLKQVREKGASPDSPITADLKQVPLGEAFDRILSPLGLDYSVADTGIVIPAAPMRSE